MSVAVDRKPVLGDWVRARHGIVGRVDAIHHRCPESEEWMAMQLIPITDEQKNGLWVSVLCDGGGAVVNPIDDVEVLDESGRMLRNLYASMYFQQEDDE